MKSYKKIFLSTLILTLLASSCDLQEANIDPSRPLKVNLNLILPTAIGQAAFNQMALPARQSGIVMQHFKGIDAQQLQYSENYVFEDNTFNNYWNFGAYGGVLKDARDLLALGTEAKQPHYVGISKVLMAEAFGKLAASFGSVPFSDALLGTKSLKPAFDTQEKVYDGVLKLLDEAIAEFSKAAVPGGPGADDLFFRGDSKQWSQMAHALKARFLMHLTKRRDVYKTVLSELQQAFSSEKDAPKFQWQPAVTAANPLAKFGIDRPNTLATHPGFGKAMTDRADPRGNFFWELDDKQYNFHNSKNTQLVWAQNNSKIPFISLTELKLYEAEAKLMTGDASGAQTALTEAIEASMNETGVKDKAAIAKYKAAYGTLASGATRQEQLKTIITEAYYALYGYGEHTIWTNYRRTGFPQITPPATGKGGLNPSGIPPQRWLYPVGEKNTNSENVKAAVAKQGPDLLDTKLWAFKGTSKNPF